MKGDLEGGKIKVGFTAYESNAAGECNQRIYLESVRTKSAPLCAIFRRRPTTASYDCVRALSKGCEGARSKKFKESLQVKRAWLYARGTASREEMPFVV